MLFLLVITLSKWEEYQRLKEVLRGIEETWYTDWYEGEVEDIEELEIPPEVKKLEEFVKKRLKELEKDPEVQRKLREIEEKYKQAMEELFKSYKAIIERCKKTAKTPLDYMTCVAYHVIRMQKET